MPDRAPVKVGANLTQLKRQLPLFKRWHRGGTIDYIEILVDNFATIDPWSLREMLVDIPVALHIMNSRFLDRAPDGFQSVASLIANWISIFFSQIYVSDHMMRFAESGFLLPYVNEVDYSAVDEIMVKLDRYQDLVKHQI